MKKKYIIIVLTIIALGIFAYIFLNRNNEFTKSELNFKKEYERQNKKYNNVEIPKNNNIEYLDEDELIKFLKNKTGIIFLGSSKDNKTRNIINTVINAVKCACGDNIYYYDPTNLIKNKQKKYKKINDILKSFSKEQSLSTPMIIFVKNGKIQNIFENKKSKELSRNEKNNLFKNIKNEINELNKNDGATTCSIEPDTSC